jgi:SAM-dependent methyltransferase
VKREWWSGFFDDSMAQVLFDQRREREAITEVAGLLRLTGLNPKKAPAVMDAACGTGRHSLALAARGFKVTGVDAAGPYVAQAQKRARRAKLPVRFETGELRDLARFSGDFDLVLNLFTSFGYYEQAADNLRALKQLAGCLKPGGTLVMELLPRESLLRRFQERDWQRTPGGFLMQQRRWLPGNRRLASSAIWVQKGRVSESNSVIFVYSRPELAALFKRAGLVKTRFFGGYGGKAFKAGGRLVITAQKP